MNGSLDLDLARQADLAVELVPALDAGQARLAVGLYRALADSQPVGTERLAARLGVPAGEVAATLGRLPAVVRDDQGRVTEFWGLSLAPTPHRLRLDGRTLYAWCAPDALFIPRILGRSAQVTSTSPTSGAPISMVVHPDGVADLDPEGAAVSTVRLEGKRFDDDVRSTFCQYGLLFASAEEGRRWAAGRPDVAVVSVAAGFELERRMIDAVLGTALHAR